MTSIIIPAHNEGGRIGGNLTLLTDGLPPDEFEIIVVANGCVDATAEIARSIRGVKVIELPEAGKVAALRAGDAVATRLARIYLDADIPLTAVEAKALAHAVGQPGVHAATGRRRVVTRGSGLPVRAYYAINRRLPVFRDGLFGRGVIALSAVGRSRFERFPEAIAADLFLDSLFEPQEKRHLPEVVTTLTAPRHTAQLIRRVARMRAGYRLMRLMSVARPASNTSWLRHVVLPRPWLWPAGICYVAVTICAEMISRRLTLTWSAS
jgi:glycosyltransferase involved in cell wall biosynthesis